MATVVEDLVAKLRLAPDKSSFSRGDKMIAGLKAAALGLGGFFAARAGINAITGWIKDTTAVGDNAVKASAKLGVTAEAFQELSHAAELSGVSQEGLQTALGKLAMNLDDVAFKGKGPAVDALKRIGLAAKDLEGNTLDQNLEIIAERFAIMPDGVKKASVAVDIFGKQGRELIPLLNEGAGGIAELRQEARDLGIVIDGESAAAMEKFNDDQERLHKSFAGIRNQVIAELLPVFQKVVDKLRTWMSENRELIKAKISSVIQGVVTAAKALWGVFNDIADWVSENRETLGEVFGVITTVIKGLIKVAKFLVKVFVGIVVAVWKMVLGIGKAFAAAWFGIEAVGKKIWKFFTEDIPNGIKAAFVAMWDFIIKLPVVREIKALIDGVKLLRGQDVQAQGNFENAKAAGQTLPGETEDQFNRRLEQNIRRRRDAARPAEPSRLSPDAGASNTNIQGGDVNINIHGNVDPNQHASLTRQIRTEVGEQMNTWLLQTREAVG